MAAHMPKLLVSNIIPVLKTHSLRQLSTIARDFTVASKPIPAKLAKERSALGKAKAPKAYTTKDRAALITKAGFAFNPPTDELTLSVRKPYVEGAGRLYFFNVSDYMTDQDRAALFMTKLGGGSFFSISLHANSPGVRYLLDISVSGAPGLTLSSITGGTSATADSKGHVLMVLDAGPHVDAAISLVVNGIGMYNFHNVVVCRI
jgi:hypothetical protein